MTTFTLRNFRKIENEIKGLKQKRVYSQRKNALCYKLSRMGTQHRAGAIERMIRDYFISQGDKVDYYGGSHVFDMLVNGKRVEVKSSIIQQTSARAWRYRFQNIKTCYFDEIILVFVKPTGIVIKRMSKRTIENKIKFCRYYANGKTLELNACAA
jgi:hypothetical protein